MEGEDVLEGERPKTCQEGVVASLIGTRSGRGVRTGWSGGCRGLGVCV